MEVLGIGASIVDQIIYVTDEYLASLPGEKGGMELIDYKMLQKILHENHQTASKVIPGGSSANTIRGLAALGHSCAFISKVGRDEWGNLLLRDLQDLDILSHYHQMATPTGCVLCLVTPDGQRTCRTFLGAYQEISINDLEPRFFQGIKLVHIEGYTLQYPGVAEKAMIYAKEAGAFVSFDLASFEVVRSFKKEIHNLLNNYIDICFGNAEEANALTDLDPRQSCMTLKNLCKIAIVSMNKEGCWVGDKNHLLRCPAYPVEALDTTGAGDLFASGFLHGYLADEPLKICAHYGALAGAAVVQIPGAHLSKAEWQALGL